MTLRWVLIAHMAIWLMLQPTTVEACCRSAKPDPTFVDVTEYYLTSITPNVGTRGGGSRVTLKGGGFNVNFFTAGNYVYIGSDSSTWVPCDVIEGACTVKCGGPNTLVCDTGPWTSGSPFSNSGWLDVKVMVEVAADGGANEVYELRLEDAYYYYADNTYTVPKLLDVFPHSASAEEPLTIRGTQLGYWIQDYRMIYVGAGRAPQGGNINNGQSSGETESTHAVCRPGELNTGKNPTEPDIALPGGADVMPEDRDPDPIKENQIVCALGDFSAGSYNVSVYMDNAKRAGAGGLNSASFIQGLAVVDADPDPDGGYVDSSLFSRDAHGVLHMVQYYPRVDSVSPPVGSVGGGTEVTVQGGGFAMGEADVSVQVGGRQCVVTFASIEKVVCNTTKEASGVPAKTKVAVNDHSASAEDVPHSWMVALQVAGDWGTVDSSPSAHGGSYLAHTAAEPSSESSAWVTFVVDPLSVAASTSGVYELFLRLPATDQCLPRATNVSVVVRSGAGYSLQVVDLRPSQNNGGTEDGDAGEFSTGNGGGAVSLGTHVLLENATTLVTVDALGAGEGACVAVDNVLLKFVGAIAQGCTDPTAENFDSEVATDDGSCLYLGGRGVTTKSWSAMAAPYKLDDWYPTEEFEAWGTGEYCEVPEGSLFASNGNNLEACWHGDCLLHRQCGAGSFCCVTDSHEGCTPPAVAGLEGVDEEGWKLVFRHDRSAAPSWEKGVWHAANSSSSSPTSSPEPPVVFSLLDELEALRRPGDGRFEFKMCWPDSGFEKCQHWIQLKNPLLNPSSTNTFATCVDCPYSCDQDPNGDPEFRGLQYNGETHLLDCDSDGPYMQLGAENTISGQDSKFFYGPQPKNDDGLDEYVSVVELYARPDPGGAACVDCKACFDQDGTVRMATYYSTASPGSAYEAPACPAFCLAKEHLPEGKPPREATLKASHQLVAATNGLEEKPCVTVISHDSTEGEDANTTLCEGKATKSTDAVPSSVAFGRNGGVSTKAFFVAPMAATYTFNTRFDDGGELWLSPNADPRAAERLLAVDSSSLSSSSSSNATTANNATTAACLSRYVRVFRARNSGGTNDRLNFAEVEVYGVDGVQIQGVGARYGESPPLGYETSGCDLDGNAGFSAIDGNFWSYFLYWGQKCDKWWQMDLGGHYDVGKVVITSRKHNGGYIFPGKLSVSLHKESGGGTGEGRCAAWYPPGDSISVALTAKWHHERTGFCGDWFCGSDGDGRCFRSFSGASMGYDLAEGACTDMGFSLGAPRSADEASAVVASMLLSSAQHWVGITDRAQEGHFSFADGTSLGFAVGSNRASVWAEEYGLTWSSATEPNDAGGNENCLRMDSKGRLNDASCEQSNAFTCEIPASQCSSGSGSGPVSVSNGGGGGSSRSSSKGVAMQEGEVRYLEMLGYSNAGALVSLLTLTVDPDDAELEAFTTSESLGLSAEFFREIRTDGPSIEVKVNGIASSCGQGSNDEGGGACGFSYSSDHTPTITAIEPATSFPGVTAITITGTGFSPRSQLNDVAFGGSPCVVSEANTTFLVCTVPLELGTAGTFVPEIKVFNKGFATGDASHTIQMTIDSIFPTSGSIYGGTTLTLTGSGFARFGLHNRISLRLQTDQDTTPKGTHDLYDDDWLWQRGNVGGSNGTADSTFSDVLCVPRTLKNRPCRYTDEDSGHECDQWLAYAKLDIRQRESAEWFDFSSPTSIECVVESLGSPLTGGSSVAVVNVSLVSTSVLVDAKGLEAGLLAAKLNFGCSELSHCEIRDGDGDPIGMFGDGWDYTGASLQAFQTYEFTSAKTPTVTHVTPARAMQGQLVDIHGSNFDNLPVTDENFYMDKFGFYIQPATAEVTIGAQSCQLYSHTATLIQCHVLSGEMYAPLGVELSVHGAGNAQSDAQFTFALDVLDIQPSAGSLAGGTTLTLTTSTLHSEAAGLGFSEFSVWFLPNQKLGLSHYLAGSLDGSLSSGVGLQCKVKASMKNTTSLSCTTTAVAESGLFGSGGADTFQADEAMQSWVVAEWNGDEIYSDCSLSPTNCTFLYSGAMTPLLNFDQDASALFLDQSAAYAAEASVVAITSGDVLKFKRETLPEALNGRAFNWGAVDPLLDVSVRCLNVSLPFTLTVADAVDDDGNGLTTAYHVVELAVAIPAELAPFASQQLEILVKPFGFAVHSSKHFSLFPAITSISDDEGSMEGGLEVIIVGHSLFSTSSSVTMGGRPCSVTSHAVMLASGEETGQQSLSCETSASTTMADDGSPSSSPQGFGPVNVEINGVGSLCLAPKRIDVISGKVVHGGCAFRFSKNATHTPQFTAVTPSHGHFPQTVTLTGDGFAASGNVVAIGFASNATVVSESSTEIVVTVPRHVGGTFRLSVSNPRRGLASGSKMWFRFDSGIASIDPKEGSRYGGQRVTITGFGFAPVPAEGFGSGSTAETEYASSFAEWTNFGTANQVVPFDFDAVYATFDTIVGTTHMRNTRSVEGDVSDYDEAGIPFLSVDVANQDEGYVGIDSHYLLAASDNDWKVKYAFDQNPFTVYDGHGGNSADNQNLEILYYAKEPIVLTDYQMVWSHTSIECPSRWVLYGQEAGGLTWELVDTMDGPRSEPGTFKYINRTVDSPGYYSTYRFIFREWAPRYGTTQQISDGYHFRDIVFNPNGFAMHYGVPMLKEEVVDYDVALGFTNVAFGKPCFLSSTYVQGDGYIYAGHLATDGSQSLYRQAIYGKSVARTSATGGIHDYLVLDLEKYVQVDRVSLYLPRDNDYYTENSAVAYGGLVVGVSDGWDLSPGTAGNTYEWGNIATVDCWGRQDCETSSSVTRCGTVAETEKGKVTGQYQIECPPDTYSRYLFLYHTAASRFITVAEVVAYGRPLLIDNSLPLPTTPVAGSSVVKTEKLGVRYSVFMSREVSLTNAKTLQVQGTQQLGISWDDAAEQCQRRSMTLAQVRTQAEASAVAEAVAKRVRYEMDFGADSGSEFTSVWLGAQRETFRPYWHWMDGTFVWESNYTNWNEGFEYSDNPSSEDNYVWKGDAKTSYLCMNAVTFVWDECPVFTTSVYAYACEERVPSSAAAAAAAAAGTTSSSSTSSYKRLYGSPIILSVNPSTGLPGTSLTITGKHLVAGSSGSSEEGFNAVNVSIGTGACGVTFVNDTVVVCTLPSLESGVLPVRLVNSLGQAGPGLLPLFTVQHSVLSIFPSSGSLGGGQLVTITGQNFPLDATKVAVSFFTSKATNTSTSFGLTYLSNCSITSSEHESVVCTTAPFVHSSATAAAAGVDSSEEVLSRYATGNGRLDNMTKGLQFPAKASVGTTVSGDGDTLRIVSQWEYTNFGDNQQPGIYVVSKDTGVEALVPGSDCLISENYGARFAAMFYDPVNKEVVSYCATKDFSRNDCSYGAMSKIGDTPKHIVTFLKEGQPEYLLVILTHHWWDHHYHEGFYSALAGCGGGERLGVNMPWWRDRDRRAYLFVGRCNAGLGKTFGAEHGLEFKHAHEWMSLELQFDPFEHFTFEHKAEVTTPEEEGRGGGLAFLDYTYDENLTPYVEWISRHNGTTAGGTTVQLAGSGFVANATTVKLAGIPCALTYDEIGDYRGKHLCEWEGVDCEGLGVSDDGTKLTCLTNPWDYSGDALNREVSVSVGSNGASLSASTALWSYANLWSSKTTWGGLDPPVEGDSVVITYGEFILLDVSPPELNLFTIQGNFLFADNVGDLALNCSYIVLHYGRLFIGTQDAPFLSKATITLVGDRNSYELPVYGAKTLAVRTAELFMHGRPRMTPWTKLAATAGVGNTTLVLRDDTDFEPGDQIFVTSTDYSMLQAEECTVQSVSADGRVIEVTKPLLYEHWGAGWKSEDGQSSLEHYRADVGLLTRNIVVQGDHKYTKREQFGAQIVMSTETNSDDNPLIAQFSNVEVRQAGQGLKLGKYPIHFHMVGNVSKSYVKNCSVHHSFNRGITIHGVDHLLVEHNVVFDTRGHTIFTEDGTERFNTIRYNLVAVVRPIWSLLLVDQSPACFWIVNPTNDVYGNVAGGSSHYGFWFRALPEPDGISGQATLDAGLARCPNWAELGDVRDNVAHSTGRHGMKVSNFFPVKGGYFCPTDAVSEPATFHNFTSFKNRHFGIWGEFLVDVNFNGLQFADQVKGGVEFKYMNGRSAKFATTLISNSVFVGFTREEIETSETEKCRVLNNCQGPKPSGDSESGLFYPSVGDHGNGWTTAINLPGIGSEVEVHNTSFHNYEKAIYGCAWCVAHRGGYEMEFFNVSLHNVKHIAHFKHGVGGILLDRDGSLTGIPGATVVPPTGQWRTNPHCTMSPGGHYTVCDNTVRRVNVGITQWRSPWWDTNIKKHYPLLIATDVTDEALDEGWNKWNRYPYETRLSCMIDKCGADHVATPKGATACFEQAPKDRYSFLAQVGRRYLVTWVDQNFIRTTADVEISVTKMKAHETMVLQFTHRPPLWPRLPMRATVAQGSMELWGELEPRMGAWSPDPNIPFYSQELQDHGGDPLADPCAAGVYYTYAYPSSCFKTSEIRGGGESKKVLDVGYEAPQLERDVNVYELVNDPTLKMARVAEGRNDNGGMLHPFAGNLQWGPGNIVLESEVWPEQYRSYCLKLASEPSRLTAAPLLVLDQCETIAGALGPEQGLNVQKFKFGYDVTADWQSERNSGKQLLWRQAVNESASAPPVWRQPLTLVLSDNPLHCLDSCEQDTPANQCGASDSSQVFLNVCEDDEKEQRLTQKWYFNDATKEIVNFGVEESGAALCLGWASSLVTSGAAVGLHSCDGFFKWDESFFKSTEVAARVHGAFFFDPYVNAHTRGVVQPRNIDASNLTKGVINRGVSTVPGSKSYVDYTIWNTSVMSVVVAGNTTLTIDTQSCPPEGCDFKVPEENSNAVFQWSDNATWAALNYSVPCTHEPTKSHPDKMCSHANPCGCGDVTIWEGWTVTLDVPTPFLNTLTIRGTLIVPHDSPIALAIHANLVEIMGGRLIIGNSSHPFTGPMFQLVLHGDMYFHGKECTKTLDSYVSKFGCWKQVVVNGELSVHGNPVPVVTRTLAADALKGTKVLRLDGPAEGWKAGDDILVSSSDAGGVPEYHVIESVTTGNDENSVPSSVVSLESRLKFSKIGTLVTISDPGNGLPETVLDGRATVSLLSRNVEIRGGYDLDYDYISGVGPDLTDYGVTIREYKAYEVVKNGWDESMVGFNLNGKLYFPDGHISNLDYVRFRGAGKQFDLEPPVREPPLVLLPSQAQLTMQGVVVTEPLTGNFFECTQVSAAFGAPANCGAGRTSLTISDSVFVGTTVNFDPGVGRHHVVKNNLFFGGAECRTDCPSHKMVSFSGAGQLSVVNNKAYGGFGGFTLRAPCSAYKEWGNNVAMGNSVGFDVEAGCTNLRLEGYRNSAGITAAVPSISNFLMVENGVGVTSGKWRTWPSEKFNLPADTLGGGPGLAHISNGIVVGRAPPPPSPPGSSGSGFSVRSSSCEQWTGGGNHPFSKGFKIGGTKTWFKWFTEYGYSGFSAQGAYVAKQGTGYNDLKMRKLVASTDTTSASDTATFHHHLDNVKFYGFSGKDSCGRRNVAISNEMAGEGEGTRRAMGAHFGKATCYPIEVTNSQFFETPDYARVRFSEGVTKSEVGYGLCTLMDTDGSVLGDSTALDSGIGPYFLKPARKHEWPPEVLRDCTAWAKLGHPDDYDGKGTCLWWLRKYENVWPTILDGSKRGVLETGARGTQYPKAFCEELFTGPRNGQDVIDNNVQLCSGMEYVVLKTVIPSKQVSGSEVLYGPVGYINQKDAFFGSSAFAHGDTFVDIYRDYTDPRGDQMPPQTGTEVETFNPIDPRYTQPYLATLVNHGFYRIEYTGDITLYDKDFIEYQLVSLTDEPRVNSDFALVVDIKFLKPVTLAFYFGGKKVKAAARRNQVGLDSPAGTHYHDPVSKVLSFVLKGTALPVRIRQLEVVSVGFGVSATFESFFEDNFLDPNVIDAAYKDKVPPNYGDTYDPSDGNIVKSNTFVRNLASVLNINPSRLRVVNVVPGNRRRLKELADKDPRKWRHLYQRALEGSSDEGLGVEFEIASVDPCEDVSCENGGVCNNKGTCDCTPLFEGPACNETALRPTLAPTVEPSLAPSPAPSLHPTVSPSLFPTTAPSPSPTPEPSVTPNPTPGTPRPTLAPTSAPPIPNPTQSPTLPPTPLPTLTPTTLPPTSPPTFGPTATPTAAAVGSSSSGGEFSFAELISVANDLATAAQNGTLDTGYDITEAVIAVPSDECGVPGGDSTTCFDSCGVVAGDNSTCSDVCGVPNGAGLSCLVADGGFFNCTHADSSTGIMSERQSIVLRGVSLLGTWRLAFNGALTESLSIYSDADALSAAVNALDTIGTATVTSTATAMPSGGGLGAVDVNVEFSTVTSTYPSNLGSLPLFEVVTDSLLGAVTTADVERACVGTGRTGFTYEEQSLAVTATSGVAEIELGNTTFVLSLNASGEEAGAIGVTVPLSGLASAHDVSEALAGMAWSGLAEGSPFEGLSRANVEVFEESGQPGEWVVRFYFSPGDDALRITEFGNVPELQRHANGSKSSSSTAAGFLSVVERVAGSVPESAMPATVDLGTGEATDAAVPGDSLGVVAVAHVCGDGIRTSAEDCDDGGRALGDGCSTNCTVESGFVCSGGVGSQSNCVVPATPTVYFEAPSFGPFDEGTEGKATIRRIGYNGSSVSVRYTAYGSTALADQSANGVCSTAGDFAETSAVVLFAEGETTKEVGVALNSDGIWEQAVTLHERLVLQLSGPVGCAIDDAHKSTYVTINDMTHANFTLGHCVTDQPSPSPTASPTRLPTSEPTHAPTMLPTGVPTQVPTSVPTQVPTIMPTGVPTQAPTGVPTPVPTRPSQAPTAAPSATPVPTQGTPNPTQTPVPNPSPLPTSEPTQLPTLQPTPEPSLAPTAVWVGVVVEATTSCTLSGYANTAAFDADQEKLFKLALVDSVALLTDSSQVVVTAVTEVTRRRLFTSSSSQSSASSRRSLLAVSLQVAYSLSNVKVGTAASVADAEASLSSQLTSSFDDSSGAATSPFTSSATTLAADASVFQSAPTVPVVDVATTLAAVDSMTVAFVSVSSPPPTAQPVAPAGAPAAPAAVPAAAGKDNKDDDDDDNVTAASLFSTLNIVLAVVIACFLFGGCFLTRYCHNWRSRCEAQKRVDADSVPEEDEEEEDVLDSPKKKKHMDGDVGDDEIYLDVDIEMTETGAKKKSDLLDKKKTDLDKKKSDLDDSPPPSGLSPKQRAFKERAFKGGWRGDSASRGEAADHSPTPAAQEAEAAAEEEVPVKRVKKAPAKRVKGAGGGRDAATGGQKANLVAPTTAVPAQAPAKLLKGIPEMSSPLKLESVGNKAGRTPTNLSRPRGTSMDTERKQGDDVSQKTEPLQCSL